MEVIGIYLVLSTACLLIFLFLQLATSTITTEIYRFSTFIVNTVQNFKIYNRKNM